MSDPKAVAREIAERYCYNAAEATVQTVKARDLAAEIERAILAAVAAAEEPLLARMREAKSALQASCEAHEARCLADKLHDHTGYREVKAALTKLQEHHDSALDRARGGRDGKGE